MKKIMISLIIAVLILSLSACNSEPSTLEEALERLDKSESYTVYTRISRALIGPYETWEYIEGNKYYLIGKDVYSDQISEEYYLFIDADDIHYTYKRGMSGQWQRERTEQPPEENISDEVDFISMSAAWFEQKETGTYVLQSDYYDEFFQEEKVTMTSLEINVTEGNLYMTYKVEDEGGYILTINTSITNIDQTTVELPFE